MSSGSRGDDGGGGEGGGGDAWEKKRREAPPTNCVKKVERESDRHRSRSSKSRRLERKK